MKGFSSYEIQEELNSIIGKYENYGNMACKCNNFRISLRNTACPYVIPLSIDETYLLRCVLHVNEDFNVSTEHLTNFFQISEPTLKKRLNNIFTVLRHYFNNTLDNKIDYNPSITEDNYNISIFNLSFNKKTVDTLRLMNCYYLRDVSHKNPEEIKHFLGDNSFNQLLSVMNYFDIVFDAWYQDYQFKKSKN